MIHRKSKSHHRIKGKIYDQAHFPKFEPSLFGGIPQVQKARNTKQDFSDSKADDKGVKVFVIVQSDRRPNKGTMVIKQQHTAVQDTAMFCGLAI